MTAGKSSAPRPRTRPCTRPAQPCASAPRTEFPAICDLPRERAATLDGTPDIVAAPVASAAPAPSSSPDVFPSGGPSAPVRDRRPRPHLETHRERAPARVPPDMYEIWLAPLRLVEIAGDQVVRRGSARAARLGRRALRPRPAGQRGRGPRARRRRPGRAPATRARARGGARGDRAGAADPRHTRGRPRGDRRTGLNPKYTFEQFVIGDANRFAHAAALAVAELPGQAYNPLFIYGPPGVGKTHLLHSIGNYVRATGDGLSVRYTTVETFTNEFIAAITQGLDRPLQGPLPRAATSCSSTTCSSSPPRSKTEEEFFHTFNALYETGSQLVLTCDRLPRDLEALEDRLRERFESGARHRDHPARPRDAPHRPAQARPARRHRARRTTAVLDADRRARADERPRARGRADPRRRLRLAHRPRRLGAARRARSSATSTRPQPPRPAAAATRGRRSTASSALSADTFGFTRRRDPLPRPPPGARLARARSPCTSRASTRARPCPRSAGGSAAATTPPSCTPAGAPPSASPGDPELFESVRRLTDDLRATRRRPTWLTDSEGSIHRGCARVVRNQRALRGSCTHPQPL